jgi:hypothetical protein
VSTMSHHDGKARLPGMRERGVTCRHSGKTRTNASASCSGNKRSGVPLQNAVREVMGCRAEHQPGAWVCC